jgi:hypothetical protein
MVWCDGERPMEAPGGEAWRTIFLRPHCRRKEPFRDKLLPEVAVSDPYSPEAGETDQEP